MVRFLLITLLLPAIVLSQAPTDDCPSGVTPAKCRIDPCDADECRSYHSQFSRCKTITCGDRCSALFSNDSGFAVCKTKNNVECSTNNDCLKSTSNAEVDTDEYCSSDGVCRTDGTCLRDDDCEKFGNDYAKSTFCGGYGLCTEGKCNWQCSWMCQSDADCTSRNGREFHCAAGGICKRGSRCQGDASKCGTQNFCGTGDVCLDDGSCVEDSDCIAPGNTYSGLPCTGNGFCRKEKKQCEWLCAWECASSSDCGDITKYYCDVNNKLCKLKDATSTKNVDYKHKCAGNSGCPVDEYCGSDQRCHEDGFCYNDIDCSRSGNSVTATKTCQNGSSRVSCQSNKCQTICIGPPPKGPKGGECSQDSDCKKDNFTCNKKDKICVPKKNNEKDIKNNKNKNGKRTRRALQSCSSRSDCHENQYCADGKCWADGTCRKVADCIQPGNSFPAAFCRGYEMCNNGQCTVMCGGARRCTNNKDCPGNKNMCISGKCAQTVFTTPCSTKDDCAEREYCGKDGVCRTDGTCQVTGDCVQDGNHAINFITCANGKVAMSCGQDKQCRRVCAGQTPAPVVAPQPTAPPTPKSCNKDADCGSTNARCTLEGKCHEIYKPITCTDHSQCPAAEYCATDGYCRRDGSCMRDDDCELIEANKYTVSCQGFRACNELNKCTALCNQQCNSDDDCASGNLRCRNGQCLPIVAPMPTVKVQPRPSPPVAPLFPVGNK